MARFILRSDGKTIDTEKSEAESYDTTVKKKVFIDFIHHYVHEGELFAVSNLWASIANDASAELLISTSTKYVHLNITINSDGKSYIYLFEGTTTSSDGTQLTAYNMNRSSAATATTTYYHTPTITDDGTQLMSLLSEGGTGPFKVGGTTKQGSEIILNKNTKYLVRVTNKTGGTESIDVDIEFYEED